MRIELQEVRLAVVVSPSHDDLSHTRVVPSVKRFAFPEKLLRILLSEPHALQEMRDATTLVSRRSRVAFPSLNR